ncbi:cilia- and flagella-associated protein 45 [Brachyistius frenatus]|uniref:cilia- and flagella-associated protein 45 n=1 Tax=Brachyistius frenatus TaxID=100188 RepID=UPI0037E76520
MKLASGRHFPGPRVDKTLFESPKPNNQETVEIITKDLVRTLRIPRSDPSGQSAILTRDEFERITAASRFAGLLKEDREEMQRAHHTKREESVKAAEEMKQRIFEIDRARKEKQEPTEPERRARDRTKRLVERSDNLRMEREVEIKELNQLIRGARCKATLDAQMQEKKQIHAELEEEERRLDGITETQRRQAVEKMEKMDQRHKQRRIQGRQHICEQIQQRLEERQVQEEMREQERQQVREKQQRMNREDLEALENKKEERRRLNEEIMRINAETMRAKEQRMEAEKQADAKQMEYIKNKQEREAEFEAEQGRVKKEKELEITRLRARQEKARDYKAEQDELRARRNRESTDREWRKKESELARRKARDGAMLRAARLEQIRSKERCASMEAVRERADFERVFKAQQEATVRRREQEERQNQRAQRHARAIRQQMKEQEMAAAAKRREALKEVEQLMEADQLRRERLEEIKDRKLQELRDTGLSEIYCAEVERKAQSFVSQRRPPPRPRGKNIIQEF